MLLYANRTTTPGLQFRVHGQLAVPDLQVSLQSTAGSPFQNSR